MSTSCLLFSILLLLTGKTKRLINVCQSMSVPQPAKKSKDTSSKPYRTAAHSAMCVPFYGGRCEM